MALVEMLELEDQDEQQDIPKCISIAVEEARIYQPLPEPLKDTIENLL